MCVCPWRHLFKCVKSKIKIDLLWNALIVAAGAVLTLCVIFSDSSPLLFIPVVAICSYYSFLIVRELRRGAGVHSGKVNAPASDVISVNTVSVNTVSEGDDSQRAAINKFDYSLTQIVRLRETTYSYGPANPLPSIDERHQGTEIKTGMGLKEPKTLESVDDRDSSLLR